jgi:glutathione S-transferase
MHFYSVVLEGKEDIEKAKYNKLKEALGWAKDIIAETRDKGYVAGTEDVTIADICFLATLSSIMAAVGAVDFEKDYPELKEYFENISLKVPNYAKANGDGATAFGALCGEKFKKAVAKINA